MTNNKGSNQYKVDPRQINFLANYLNPESPTYSNCLQSALSAGYRQEYAENLLNLMPKWLSESMDKIGDMTLLKKAEKVLNATLDYDPMNGNTKIDTSLVAIQNKTAQFIAGTLGKNKFSTKGEEGITKLAESITGMKIIKENGASIQDPQ